jgi:hypothetical protein
LLADTHSEETNSSVTFGDIGGGIHSSTIAGRDVIAIRDVIIQAGTGFGSQEIEGLINKLEALVDSLDVKNIGPGSFRGNYGPRRGGSINFPTPKIDPPPSVPPIVTNASQKMQQDEDALQKEPEQYDSYCIRLKSFLQDGKWKEADLETTKVILIIADRQEKEVLHPEDIERFPCTAIKTIDNLWKEHSNNRFGFSVQRRIWCDVANHPDKFDPKSLDKFGDRLGWCVAGKWLSDYNSFIFSLDAPEGHLPLLRISTAENKTSWWQAWKRNFTGFLSRTEICFSNKY